MSIFSKTAIVFLLPMAAFINALPAYPALEASVQKHNFRNCAEEYWKYLMEEFPGNATFVGYPGQNQRWTDLSEEAIKRRQDFLQELLFKLNTVDSSQLNSNEKLDYAILKRELESEEEGMQFRAEYLLVTQISGVHQDVERLISMMPKSSVEHYEDILARLKAIPKFFDQSIILLDKGLNEGITPPKITLRKVPGQLLSFIPDDPLDSVLFQPFLKFPDTISQEDQLRITRQAINIFDESVYPAYRKLYIYLKDVYIPGCRETTAWGDMPQGHEWYSFKVRNMTTTALSPKEIHEIGLKEVARIRIEMNTIIEGLGLEDSIHDFTQRISNDPQFFYTDRESLLNGYRAIIRKLEAVIPNIFGRLPKQPLEILPVPAYKESSASSAYYMTGSVVLGRPGYFFVNTYHLPGKLKWEMEALALHEGLPGHHLERTLANEIEGQADFRKLAKYTAYVEGWGLYSESLGDELGLYQNPYSKFGKLKGEMWRAIRLVVDTGMHELGWSRQKAIDYFVENIGKDEVEVTNEVDRYLVWPGQALAYKIGELKIKELRSIAEKTLGDQFEIRDFHDALLSHGALPLDVLENLMLEWFEERVNLNLNKE